MAMKIDPAWFALSAPRFVMYAAEAQHLARLMSDAQFVTKRTPEEIRTAAARSPLSFDDFVAALKRGYNPWE